MPRAARTLLHAILLGLLVAGALYGVMKLAGYLVMLGGAVSGQMPRPDDLTASEVAFGVVMVGLWSLVIVAGLWSLIRQARRTVGLAQWVARTSGPPSLPLATAADRADCLAPIVEARSESAYAFTHGIWRPRVVVSSGLVEQATHDELAAVLRHEDWHVRNRDPLKVLAFRTWSAAFAFLPVVRAMFQRILDRQELKADRAAVREHGVVPVAGALLKAVGEPDLKSGPALAAISGPDLLEDRITHLETGRVPGILPAIRPTLTPSLPGVGLVAVYGTLLYQVCIAAPYCCAS